MSLVSSRGAQHERELPGERARARARRALSVVLVAALATLALLASALVHLATPLGREAARDLLVALLSRSIRGTAHVGEITTLDLDRIDLTDFRVDGPDGETVIATARMGGELGWSELLDTGTIEIAPSYFDRAEIWLRASGPDGQVGLVHAMEVPDDRWTIPVALRDIRLIDNVIHIDLPGKPGVTLRGVHGLADLRVDHEFVWRMDRNRGYADIPLFELGFRHMSGRLRSDHAHPLRVQMLLDLELAEPGARFDYRVPALAGERGEPYFDLDVPVDLGISEARDDCAEGDREHCPEARREEEALARERARRAERRRAKPE